MMNEILAFIGGGNMARSLIGGLIAQGLPASQIIVADPTPAQRTGLQEQFGVRTTANNREATEAAQVLVLAVKPQQLRAVALELAPTLSHRPLIISVAAGVRAADLERWLGNLPVVRTMPNRPALNGYGMTGMYAAPSVPPVHRELASKILSAVGKTLWVEKESQMDAVTAVSGSGPAYFFLLMELLEAAGIKQGLSPEISRALAVETAFGAGYMAREESDSPAQLREQVTSKGGTTAAALRQFEAGGFPELVNRAVQAAVNRSMELAVELAKESS